MAASQAPGNEEVVAARIVVRRTLGSDVESKATDAFCVAHAPRMAAVGMAFGAESVGPRRGDAPSATIVEFGADTVAHPSRARSISSPKVRKQLAGLRSLLPDGGSVRSRR